MPRETKARLLPSIMDRLTQPELSDQATPYYDVEQLKRSVIRDLSDLLNTKRPADEIPRQYKHAASSVAAYGLPDFASFSLANKSHQEDLRRSIEYAIRMFEPRLTRVSVSLRGTNPDERSLRYRIEAFLNVSPAPELVAFDTVLEPDFQRFEVKGEGR